MSVSNVVVMCSLLVGALGTAAAGCSASTEESPDAADDGLRGRRSCLEPPTGGADATTPSAGGGVDPAPAPAPSSPTPGTSPSALTSTDPRVVYWIDPRAELRDLAKWSSVTQVHGDNQLLASVSEPGILGAGSDYALSRGADPLDPSRSAYRHRIAGAFPTWGTEGARRSEISADWSAKGHTVLRGVDYWIAFAMKFDPDMFGGSNGDASLLDFHQVPDPGESWLPSSLSMYSGDDSLSFVVRWHAGQPTIAKNPPSKTLWNESSPSMTEWHRFVMKLRLHWDPGQQPYVRIWRAVGEGPTKKIVDYSGPNDYENNAPYVPQKFGLYRWDAWTGKPTRTMYTKGFYVIRDESGSPTLEENAVMDMLKEI